MTLQLTSIPPIPDLRVLSEILRTGPSDPRWPEILRTGPSDPRWPEGLEWDYSDCRHCALEIVNQLWLHQPSPIWIQSMVDAFSIPFDVADAIFITVRGASEETQRHITSVQVADAINAYLARSAP